LRVTSRGLGDVYKRQKDTSGPSPIGSPNWGAHSEKFMIFWAPWSSISPAAILRNNFDRSGKMDLRKDTIKD
jgi:hypothetical protein